MYRYNNASEIGVCCGANNRGLAILGDTLFMGTLDATLVAIDTKDGTPIWKTKVADSKMGYSLTVAPLAIKDRVVRRSGWWGVRHSRRDRRVRCQNGKELWRFNTIPGAGEPGHETWEACPPNPVTYCDPVAWTHGGGSVWVTGSYDPALNLTYWGVGNAGPTEQPISGRATTSTRDRSSRSMPTPAS
jgi:alcohol dehydrogenase (cytochrome c)